MLVFLKTLMLSTRKVLMVHIVQFQEFCKVVGQKKTDKKNQADNEVILKLSYFRIHT